MAKLPAFQFYPGDWRKDPGVQALDYFERGVWIELLCLMHESEEPGRLVLGGKPYPEDRLCRLLGLSPEVMGKVIITLITLNVARLDPETGIIYSKRMVKDRELSSKRAKGGILGGNPNFKAGKPNPYYQKDNLGDNLGDNQKITPSSSSSPSGSKKKERKIFQPPTVEDVDQYAKSISFPLDASYWVDYWAQRGWTYSKGGKMQDWKAAVRTWRTNEKKGSKNGVNGKHPAQFKSAQEKREDRLRAAIATLGQPGESDPGPDYQDVHVMPEGCTLPGHSGL